MKENPKLPNNPLPKETRKKLLQISAIDIKDAMSKSKKLKILVDADIE